MKEHPGEHMEFDLDSRRVLCTLCGARSVAIEKDSEFEDIRVSNFKKSHTSCAVTAFSNSASNSVLKLRLSILDQDFLDHSFHP